MDIDCVIVGGGGGGGWMASPGLLFIRSMYSTHSDTSCSSQCWYGSSS